jgi:hypothetical protein
MLGRRFLFLVALLVSAACGFCYAMWSRTDLPEQDPSPIVEKQISPEPSAPPPVTEKELVGRELIATAAFAPGQGFPAAFPWHPLLDIGARGGCTLENMLQTRPLAFLRLCVERFDREVQGYRCVFVKKERIEGKLYPPGKDDYEIIKVACREHPFSVFFDWEKHRKLASRALYVEGQNNGKIVARPFVTFLPVQERDLNDPDAKKSGRFTMAEFGMGLAVKRTVAAMERARDHGTLHVRYEGKVNVEMLGGRPCYKFIRTPYEPPEDHDRVYELTLYYDCENWLQVGSILRNPEGQLLAEYFFRDVELTNDFDEKQFTRAKL